MTSLTRRARDRIAESLAVQAGAVHVQPYQAYGNLAALAKMVATAPGEVPVDFEFKLDLLIGGLDRLRADDPG